MPNRRFKTQDAFIRSNLLKHSGKAVINLSNHPLTEDEKILLTRGLSFCPQPSKGDKTLLHRDALLFNRRLRLNHWFKDTPTTEPDPFIARKGWTPPCGKSPTLDTFINVVTNEILKPRPPPPTCHNLTAGEIAALKTISQNQNIIIKRADKGGAVVLMNKLDYIQEGLRQLNDTKFYTKIPKDTTNKIATDIQNFLQFLKARKLLPVEHISFLTPKNPRTPIFYLLPKIHKRNNPGRPIVSACDGPTEKLSALGGSYACHRYCKKEKDPIKSI